MDVSLVNSLDPTSTHFPCQSEDQVSINAFGGARPKRPIRGQQFQQNAPPSYAQNDSAPPVPSQYDQNKAISNLQRQVSGLSRQFTELMAARTSPKQGGDSNSYPRPSNSYPRPSNNYPRSSSTKPKFFPKPLEYTMDGRPICLYCKNPGHLKRDCRKKAAADLRRPSGNQ